MSKLTNEEKEALEGFSDQSMQFYVTKIKLRADVHDWLKLKATQISKESGDDVTYHEIMHEVLVNAMKRQ